MMLQTPLHTECVVSGTLRFVLQLSRIMGTAPFKCDKARDGLVIQISEMWSLYSKIIVIIFVACELTALTADLSVDTITSLKIVNKANRILWTTDVAVVGAVIIAAVFTGSNRMRHLIDCVAQLNQVNKKLKRYRKSNAPDEAARWTVVLLSFTFGCITEFSDFSYFIMIFASVNGKVLSSCLYVFYNIVCVQIHLLVLQFAVVAMSVLPALSTLNSCLNYKLTAIIKESSIMVNLCSRNYKSNQAIINCLQGNGITKVLPFKEDTKKNDASLNRLTDLYCSLCDVIRNLNESQGMLVVMLLTSFLIKLILTTYNLINGVFKRGQLPYADVVLQLAAFIYHFAKVALVVEPCHRTQEQIARTRELINQIKRFTPPDDVVAITELKYFHQHFSMNQVIYSPMHLFTLNRTLILAMMSSITTYLVVAIQS